MALQSSGQISLNDIHVEAGGSSGTSASINDSDIRGLIGKGSGKQMSFSEWYGASAFVDLSVKGSTSWAQTRTTALSSSRIINIPSGTRAIIAMGSLGTNGSRRTQHKSVTIGGTSMTKVSSQFVSSQYSFDSAIFALNYSSTGNKTVTFNYTNGQYFYGSGHHLIFLSKPFVSYTPTVASGTRGETGNLTFDTGIGVNYNNFSVATATVNGKDINNGIYDVTFRNFYGSTIPIFGSVWPNNVRLVHGSDRRHNRNSVFAYKSSQGGGGVGAKLMSRDYGETIAYAEWAPSKFTAT